MANPCGQGRVVSMSCLALGLGLLTETSFALEQTPSPTLVAQVTGSAPPSGVLRTPQPAPVVAPPSGVLVTVERRAFAALPFKTAQKLQITKRASAITKRRHIVHRSANRREAARPTSTGDQSAAAIPLVAKTIGEPPRRDGSEILFAPFGKGKAGR